MSKNAPRHASLFVFAALFATVLMGVVLASRSEASHSEPPTVRVIVLLEKERGDSVYEKAERLGGRFDFEFGRLFRHAVRGFSARVPEPFLDDIRESEGVLMVSPDRYVESAAQTLPTGVNRIEGDASTALSGNGSGAFSSGPAVAVLDSGSGPHADINRVGGVNCQTGKNFDDPNGHGTHVAGIIGARDDSNGVVGMAPGIPIYSVRVLDSSLGARWSNLICGIDWITANAAAKNIKVANMSLSSTGTDDGNCGNSNNDALHRALCASVAAGVTYVASAGNSGASLAKTVPASYDEVLTVTAMTDFNGNPGGGATSKCDKDKDDTGISWSNFATSSGPDTGHVVAAPGVCVNSTWKGGGYKVMSGTSMASPHVAGTVALCIATASCLDLGPGGIVAKLHSEAALPGASYGFTDDTFRPVGGRYYGNLVYAGGF